MKFSTEINRYLKGELFSAGLDVSFSDEKFPDITRIGKILELTKNNRVIHVGCADHLPLIEEKIKNRKWLHGLLIENTSSCYGIDNNEEAVRYINDKLGIKEVFCRDILNENNIIEDNLHWDFLILGEIIEHIDNPVAFLTQINKLYKDKVDKILITAPNIYNLLTIKDIRNNLENINTDHRYWFSPYTLTKIVSNSGFYDCELFFSERVKLPFFKAVFRRLKVLFGIPTSFKANCFSNLIMIANFDDSSKNELHM